MKPAHQEVFKYSAINDYTLSNLKQRKLWASSPLVFNDPFEFKLQRDSNPTGIESIRRTNPDLLHLPYDETLVGVMSKKPG